MENDINFTQEMREVLRKSSIPHAYSKRNNFIIRFYYKIRYSVFIIFILNMIKTTFFKSFAFLSSISLILYIIDKIYNLNLSLVVLLMPFIFIGLIVFVLVFLYYVGYTIEEKNEVKTHKKNINY